MLTSIKKINFIVNSQTWSFLLKMLVSFGYSVAKITNILLLKKSVFEIVLSEIMDSILSTLSM